MKKPLVFDPIHLKVSSGITTLQRSSIFSDSLELLMSPLGDGQFRTLSTPAEIDTLIDALQKGKAAMIAAQTLTLSDLSTDEYFRFTGDPIGTIRRIRNASNGYITSWNTIEGNLAAPLFEGVVRLKVTATDVTE